MIGLILLIILLLILIGGGTWGWRGGLYGTYPAPYYAGLGVVIIIIILLLIFARPLYWW